MVSPFPFSCEPIFECRTMGIVRSVFFCFFICISMFSRHCREVLAVFYDGRPSSSRRKKRTSMSRSIASGFPSMRSASSMSSGLTEIRSSIFPSCESLIHRVFRVWCFLSRGRRDAPPFHLSAITIRTRYHPRMKLRGIVYDWYAGFTDTHSTTDGSSVFLTFLMTAPSGVSST